MNTSLEPVVPGQEDDLLPLVREFNAIEGIPMPLDRVRAALVKLLAEPALGRAWFVRSEGGRVGYVTLMFGYDLEYAGRDAWICDVYVQPPFQNRGIGGAVMILLEKEAVKNDVRALHLMVRPSNARAMRLYSRCGFGTNPRTTFTKRIDGGEVERSGKS